MRASRNKTVQKGPAAVPERVRNRQVWSFHGPDPALQAQERRAVAEAGRIGAVLQDPPDDDAWSIQRDGVTTRIHQIAHDDLMPGPAARGLAQSVGRGVRMVLGWRGLWRASPRIAALLSAVPVVAFAPFFAFALPAQLAYGVFSVLALAAWFVLVRLDLLSIPNRLAELHALSAGGAAWDRYRDAVRTVTAQISLQGDQIVLVGHGPGGFAAVLAAADLRDRLGPDQRFSLLTLGAPLGLVLTRHRAGRDALANAIGRIAADARITWVDVAAQADLYWLPVGQPALPDLSGADHNADRDDATRDDANQRDQDQRDQDRDGQAGAGQHGPYLVRIDRNDGLPGPATPWRTPVYVRAAPVPGGFDYLDIVTGPDPVDHRIQHGAAASLLGARDGT